MKRTDLQYRVIDDDNEQLVIEAFDNGLIIQTSGPVELSDEQIAAVRNQLTLILETSAHITKVENFEFSVKASCTCGWIDRWPIADGSAQQSAAAHKERQARKDQS